MFEYLKAFDKIVVSGPQRTGTTICTKMIAADTGHECLLEESFSGENFWGDFENLYKTLLSDKKVVCQVPSLSPYVHLLPENVAVIFMMRHSNDIRASEKRINWQDQQRQLERYFRTEGEAHHVKYEVWDKYQKPHIKNCFEIPYGSLEGHPLWIEKDKRKDFGPRQTNLP